MPPKKKDPIRQLRKRDRLIKKEQKGAKSDLSRGGKTFIALRKLFRQNKRKDNDG